MISDQELATLRELMQYWFAPHGASPAELPTPNNYIFFDVETTGVEFATDLVTEVGWAIVRDRRVVDYGGHLLNWAGYLPAEEWAFFAARLAAATATMQERGRQCHITAERLLREGQDPLQTLRDYRALLQDAMARQELLVGHNAWAFDSQMLSCNCARYMQGASLDWGQNAVFDTGLVERAIQLRRLPWPGDSLDSWSRRTSGPPYFVKWSLEEHCAAKYDLLQRYQLPAAGFHQAGFDCLVGVSLFETYRDLGGI